MVADGIMGFRRDLEVVELKAATAAAVIVPLVVVDMTFFTANFLKPFEGARGAAAVRPR